ncbi:MAG: hypothetical protein DRN05_06090 [Thermoplasmata archaeon]|nr:KH domain-containing protein [Deltaproteobacteria bacterium]RLF27117.1 MAG: hypothetical protein DRN05_06090 [Thermoplasmata archaeon]
MKIRKEFEELGKDEEDAIKKICAKYDLTPDQIEWKGEVVSEKKIFGLLDKKNYRVKAWIKEDVLKEKEKEFLRQVVEEIVYKIDIFSEVKIEEKKNEYRVNINGDGSGILIGKHGKNLDAIQYLVNKICHKNGNFKKRIVIDAEGYKAKREEKVKNLAIKLGNKVKKSLKPVVVGSLNALERRIIHMALKNDKRLRTKSFGKGDTKKIIIIPATKKN